MPCARSERTSKFSPAAGDPTPAEIVAACWVMRAQ